MFLRICLLCLILSCRFVIGRLPADVSPINTFKDEVGHIVSKFAGVHSIVFFDRGFYVLARNQVYSLRVVPNDDGPAEHRFKTVIAWASSVSADSLCRRKTRHPDSCNNFIRIFAPKDSTGREIIVCGTHSFDPKCRIYQRDKEEFKTDTRNDFSGSSICPFDPKQTGASVYAGGDVYSATVEDFLGRKPVIYRHAVGSARTNLERTKRDEAWLLDPWFVKFVDAGSKVYVFFKENAVEDNSGLKYSRVAQICKSDEGGDHILRKQFTSYQKARLNCSFPGNPPFYFDELSAVSDFVAVKSLPGKKILFAAMNTPRNSIWGSAVCVFVDEDIEDTFRKPYLEQHLGVQGVSYWSQKQSDESVTEALSRCQFDEDGKSVLSDENLQFVRDHPLKSHSVPSWAKDGKTSVPVFMKLNANYQFTAIATDSHAGSTGLYLVLLLGTTDGKVLKIVPPLSDEMTESHFVGETFVYNESECGSEGGEDKKSVQDIKIDKENGYILVAFSSCVISIPLCPISSACERECISARDPYCAWDGDECVSVKKPEGLEQDVLNGDVTGLPPCESVAVDVEKEEPEEGEDDGNVSPSNATSTYPSNTTVPVKLPQQDLTTAETRVGTAFLVPGVIGFASAVIFFIVVVVLGCLLKSARKKLEANDGQAPDQELKHFVEDRNSHGQKQERPNSNHTQRQHSSEDEAFLDNGSEGNTNSIEKAKRKREKSANRKSNASSYRREDSLEKNSRAIAIDRQTSRESNPESGVAGEQEQIFIATDFTQPPSPQSAGFHRTFSASNARTEGMTPRQAGRELRRQLSLQIPANPNASGAKYYQNLTPMRFGMQNPLEIHNQQQQAPAFDPSTAPTWHSSPAKNPHGLPRQNQTTSLDRKLLKAGGMAHATHAIPHDVQQQSRSYADTLPPHAMDDVKVAQGRRRYTSESMGMGASRPPLIFASKHPAYQSIEEERSPMLDQHSPTKFPTNLAPRTVGRARPNHLPLGGVVIQPQQYVVPYSNPGTPMTEQMPRFIKSPMQNTGHTLPTHLRRQMSEAPRYTVTQRNEFPHPQSAPSMKSYPSNEKQSKSNPATPDWDGNHNSFFPEPTFNAENRKRNPSGKSGTPTTPIQSFSRSGRPDVIPTSTARTPTDPSYPTSNEILESTA